MIWLMALALMTGCAHAKGERDAECHVLAVDPIQDTMGPTKYIAWCGEGRYVVFRSTVSVGDFVQFMEYQEEDQLQIHGYIKKRHE